jgi:hypothetical protein
MAQPEITAPIASVTSLPQLDTTRFKQPDAAIR